MATIRDIERPRMIYLVGNFDRGGAELGLFHLLRYGFFDRFDLRILAIAKGSGEVASMLRSEQPSGGVMALTVDRKMRFSTLMRAFIGLIREIVCYSPALMITSLPQAHLLGRLASFLRPSIRLVAFEHSIRYAKPAYRYVLKPLSFRVSVVLYDCEATYHAAAKWHYVHNKNRQWFSVSLLSFDDTRPPRRNYTLGKPVTLLTVGRLAREKNFSVCLEATQILITEGYDIRLIVAGEGALYEALIEYSMVLGIEKYVHFAGFQADWSNLRGEADIYLQPSLREGLSVATLEAMADGLPVLASDVGGIKDYGHDGENILKLLDPSPQSVVAGLRHLLTDEAFRAKIGRQAAIDARRLYGRHTIAHQWEECQLALLAISSKNP